jgi:hypothetical protein
VSHAIPPFCHRWPRGDAPGALAGAIRLRDWSTAERLAADDTWRPDADTMPHEMMRPLVLRRQLDPVEAILAG